VTLSTVSVVSGSLVSTSNLRMGSVTSCEVLMANALEPYTNGFAIIGVRYKSDEGSSRDKTENQIFIVDGLNRLTILNTGCNPIQCWRYAVLSSPWTSRDIVMKATSIYSGYSAHMTTLEVEIDYCTAGMYCAAVRFMMCDCFRASTRVIQMYAANLNQDHPLEFPYYCYIHCRRCEYCAPIAIQPLY
jgi:hypothetical protein